MGLDDALAWLERRGADDAFAYVVTPNVDHCVRLADSPEQSDLHAAYAGADLCLCDSRVLALLARLRGIDLPVAPGSDLTARLLAAIQPGRKLLLIGGDETARARLGALLPGVAPDQPLPPMGLRHRPDAMAECVAAAVAARADYVLLAVGSPQQELVAAMLSRHPDARGTALCIGASVDFLTGRARRAPRWMQRLALEWLHRLLSEPRRMARRYLVEGPRILRIALRS
ncbi:MAG TPA: WecB/TagA/CpsF family glycosyltransferase [Novosphingobium sp.]|nr:WecB/TagA/CpsF family glycosyltransferase [Novosphingobium sp.]